MDDFTGYQLVPAAWMGRAACRGLDPTLFFVTRGELTDEAKQVCQTCPVRRECAEYAGVTRQNRGIWGGQSERQRRSPRPHPKLRKLPPAHGTTTGYARGCRCDRCTEASSADKTEPNVPRERDTDEPTATRLRPTHPPRNTLPAAPPMVRDGLHSPPEPR